MSLRALREIMIKKVHAETAKGKTRKDRREIGAGMSLRALREIMIKKVLAETAKGKTRKDRRESRFRMSLRSLRANPIWPKLGVIQCIQKSVTSRLSLRALREIVLS
jgi:hypothetical protein